MEEMCDDGVDEGIDTEDDEFDGQLGTSHLVIASGEAQIEPFTPPHSVSLVELPRIQAADDASWQEFALEDEAILVDLPISKAPLDTDDAPFLWLSPLSTPPSSLLSLPPLAASPPLSSSGKHHSESNSSKPAIAIQNVLSAEDDLVKALRYALSVCDDKDHHLLDHHISPSIREQLSGNYNPLPLVLPEGFSHDQENHASSPSVPSPPKRLRCLVGFEHQKKERCHESHGIR